MPPQRLVECAAARLSPGDGSLYCIPSHSTSAPLVRENIYFPSADLVRTRPLSVHVPLDLRVKTKPRAELAGVSHWTAGPARYEETFHFSE